MKKVHIIGVALFAMLAFGAITASSAFAVEGKWLIDGVEPAVLTPVDSEGLLILEDLKGGLFGEASKVDCEGILVGSIGPTGEDETTEVLNLAGEKITELSTLPLICKVESGCPEANAEVFVENLPWLSQLELMEPVPGEMTYLDLFFKAGAQPAYEAVCFGVTDLCEGETSATLTNNELPALEGNVLAQFIAADQVAENLEATCTRGGAKTGVLIGEGITLLTGSLAGHDLTVSE